MIKIYAVTADYRPKNPKKPIYYVLGNNKKEAKKRFSNVISWLKIYDIRELNQEEERELKNKGREEYILI